MYNSIRNDIRGAFTYGNMVMRLIIVNISVFIALALIEVFTRNLGIYQPIINNIAVPTSPIALLYKPWTLGTYMFVQEGFWHLLWNMIGLNIFGVIVGDLIGDRRVLPIYLMGGLAGALLVVVLTPILSNLTGSYMIGASASVMALAMVAALVAPDYNIRLMFIGNVRLKYIVLFFIVFSLISSQGLVNAGGHYAHIGGMLFGALFVRLLKSGTDILKPVEKLIKWFSQINQSIPPEPKYRPVMKVEHRSPKIMTKNSSSNSFIDGLDYEDNLNRILDKIKEKGYQNLSVEEKEFLNKASQR